MFTRFNALLGAMLAIIVVVGPFQDALFGFVLVVNTGVGIVQELRAKRTLDRLSLLTAPSAHVVREGRVLEVPVDRVVLDDVLELSSGRQIIVDGEVLVSDGLELDESLISGEPEPVSKRSGDQALSGSFVAAGAGRMVATAVGADAYASKLAFEARRFTLVRSERRRPRHPSSRLAGPRRRSQALDSAARHRRPPRPPRACPPRPCTLRPPRLLRPLRPARARARATARARARSEGDWAILRP